jgi:hypothetical protein
MTLFHLRVFAFMLAGLVIVLGLARCGDDRHPLAVEEVTLAPAAGCPALKTKPCDKMDCNVRNLT